MTGESSLCAGMGKADKFPIVGKHDSATAASSSIPKQAHKKQKSQGRAKASDWLRCHIANQCLAIGPLAGPRLLLPRRHFSLCGMELGSVFMHAFLHSMCSVGGPTVCRQRLGVYSEADIVSLRTIALPCSSAHTERSFGIGLRE